MDHDPSALTNPGGTSGDLPLSSSSDQYGPKRELKEQECYTELGESFPTWKKWTVISSIFIVQCSMNYNTAVYPNAIPGMCKHFGVTKSMANNGQAAFLLAYGIGSELWAPWSEEFGRKPILQLSLLLVNLWQIPAIFAPNFNTILAARVLGGLSSAGGSVTLGMVADMWGPDVQQFAVCFVVLSSVAGSAIGPVFGGFLQYYLDWRWNFWTQLIFGVFTQLLHLTMPETRSSVMMDKIAKRRRKAARAGNGPIRDLNVYGPNEISTEHRITFKGLGKVWWRPFHMFLFEPIVLFLSLLSGFSDALIFTFLESFTPVFKQWGFNAWQTGLCFVAILLGYIIAYGIYTPHIWRDREVVAGGKRHFAPERRLWLLRYLAPLEAIGLIGFAFTSLGPLWGIPWIAPLLFAVLIAIANFAIYMATIDYMVAAYGEYSASATGGNALARDVLAGVSAYYAYPLYHDLFEGAEKSIHAPNDVHGRVVDNRKNESWNLAFASLFLGFLAVVVVVPVYAIYARGSWIRGKSKFAEGVARDRAAKGEARSAVQNRKASPTRSELAAGYAGGAGASAAGATTTGDDGAKVPGSDAVDAPDDKAGAGAWWKNVDSSGCASASRKGSSRQDSGAFGDRNIEMDEVTRRV
ncbi:MAG: hypothetical protein M1831_002172 [Alyxoria varia]|nr:MAG: hypothetical protein M1831_002172 [Alyxoria varia]